MDSISYKMDRPDALFINGEHYLIDRSPLKYVDNGLDYTYREIYREDKTPKIIEIDGPSFDGREGRFLEDYYSYWLIKDNKLYLDSLRYIYVCCEKYSDHKVLCAEMEKFTGCKFDDSGKMFASWVTGEIYAKRVNTTPRSNDYYKEEKNFEIWLYAPLTKLIFKNGVLVAREIVTTE